MANVLRMALIESILSLHAQHWSQRRIACELGVDRETVRKYLRERLCRAKPANAPTGSEGSNPATLLAYGKKTATAGKCRGNRTLHSCHPGRPTSMRTLSGS